MSNMNSGQKNATDPPNVPDVFRAAFGAAIAIILLVLYAYAVVNAIQVAQCVTQGTCPAASFGDGLTQVLTLVGGLVSALVIAELAITKRDKPPGAHLLPNATPNQLTVLVVVSIVYIVAWIGLGLASFFFGVVQYPKAVQPLSDMGSAWLGLAVAAGYSYFGISPE